MEEDRVAEELARDRPLRAYLRHHKPQVFISHTSASYESPWKTLRARTLLGRLADIADPFKRPDLHIPLSAGYLRDATALRSYWTSVGQEIAQAMVAIESEEDPEPDPDQSRLFDPDSFAPER
jgi:hypothetical protein